MKFLLLCCFEEQRWAALQDPERDRIMREYGELMQRLDRDGTHLAGAQLQPTASASTIRARNGRAVVTDGPFAETKEQLGGYHLIECRDAAEAIEIAKRIPTLPFGGTVEVRPLASAAARETDSLRRAT